MKVIYKGKLRALYYDAKETCGLPPPVVKAYRRAVGFLRNFADERSVRAMKGWQMRKFSDGTPYIRLNDQFRLFLTFDTVDEEKTVTLHKIDDPH